MSDPKIPDNLDVEVRYIRRFNEHGHCEEYTTVARLFDQAGNTVGIGAAYLAPGDQPVRKTGRHKAIGRAVQNYLQNMAYDRNQVLGELS